MTLGADRTNNSDGQLNSAVLERYWYNIDKQKDWKNSQTFRQNHCHNHATKNTKRRSRLLLQRSAVTATQSCVNILLCPPRHSISRPSSSISGLLLYPPPPPPFSQPSLISLVSPAPAPLFCPLFPLSGSGGLSFALFALLVRLFLTHLYMDIAFVRMYICTRMCLCMAVWMDALLHAQLQTSYQKEGTIRNG